MERKKERERKQQKPFKTIFYNKKKQQHVVHIFATSDFEKE